MKSLLQSTLLTAIAFYITSQVFSGLQVSGGVVLFLSAGFCFVLVTAVLKPILSLFAFPFAFLSTLIVIIVSNSIALYVTALILKSVKVSTFSISNTVFYGLTIPNFNAGPLLSYVIISVIIAVLVRVFSWVFDLE